MSGSRRPSSETSAGELDLAAAAEIAPGTLRPFEIAGLRIVVCRAGDEYFAIEDRCPHTGAPLARGRIRGDCIVCPVHGARFRLRDGRHLSPPAPSGLRTFLVRIREGRVRLSPEPIDPPGGAPDPRAFSG